MYHLISLLFFLLISSLHTFPLLLTLPLPSPPLFSSLKVLKMILLGCPLFLGTLLLAAWWVVTGGTYCSVLTVLTGEKWYESDLCLFWISCTLLLFLNLSFLPPSYRPSFLPALQTCLPISFLPSLTATSSSSLLVSLVSLLSSPLSSLFSSLFLTSINSGGTSTYISRVEAKRI